MPSSNEIICMMYDDVVTVEDFIRAVNQISHEQVEEVMKLARERLSEDHSGWKIP